MRPSCLHVYFACEADKARVECDARTAGYASVSEYARVRLLDSPPESKLLREQILTMLSSCCQQLNRLRMGENLDRDARNWATELKESLARLEVLMRPRRSSPRRSQLQGDNRRD